MTRVRYGSVIGVRPEMTERYEELHRNAPPAVLQAIADCNIVNYSIFRYHEQLISYFEYVGEDYEADMRKMAEDPATQEWWAVCKPMQAQTPDRVDGSWWTPIAEVFHIDLQGLGESRTFPRVGPAVQTVAAGTLSSQGEFAPDLGLLFAGPSLGTVPAVILYLTFNRLATKGIALHGVFR